MPDAFERWPVRPGTGFARRGLARPTSRVMLRDGRPVVSHARQNLPERALLDADKRIVWADR